MKSTIPDLLDKAMVIHKLPSYYKLALVMGVDHKSLRNYRDGKTLPDARVLVKLCELTGDDAGVLLAEIEEQRAKTDEAKALWHQIAARLQSAAAAGVFSVVFLIAAMGGLPMSEANAKAQFDSFISYTSWNIARMARLFRALLSPAVRYLRGLITGSNHVFGTASTAAA